MPSSNSRVALKTALLAPAGPIMAWGFERLVSGDTATGAVALAIGLSLTGAFVLINEYDIPYEDEIVELIENVASQEATEEAAKEASEQVGEYVEEQTDGSDGGDDA